MPRSRNLRLLWVSPSQAITVAVCCILLGIPFLVLPKDDAIVTEYAALAVVVPVLQRASTKPPSN